MGQRIIRPSKPSKLSLYPFPVVVLPDIHIPYHDVRALKAVNRFIRDLKPRRIVQLGDFMDFDMISRFNADLPGMTEGRVIARDYIVGNQVLDDIQNAAPNAEIDMMEGNHDWRILAYLAKHPELRGLLEVDINLRLRERHIEYHPFWESGDTLTIGKANYIHGNYTNDTHAKKHVMAYGESVFYGHTHDVQLYSLVTRGSGKTRVGQSLGCLCTLEQGYLHGRPSRWQQALGVFWFWEDGSFNYTVPMIFNGRFVYDGQVYDGNKL